MNFVYGILAGVVGTYLYNTDPTIATKMAELGDLIFTHLKGIIV
jgi:hypothetical protein